MNKDDKEFENFFSRHLNDDRASFKEEYWQGFEKLLTEDEEKPKAIAFWRSTGIGIALLACFLTIGTLGYLHWLPSQENGLNAGNGSYSAKGIGSVNEDRLTNVKKESPVLQKINNSNAGETSSGAISADNNTAGSAIQSSAPQKSNTGKNNTLQKNNTASTPAAKHSSRNIESTLIKSQLAPRSNVEFLSERFSNNKAKPDTRQASEDRAEKNVQVTGKRSSATIMDRVLSGNLAERNEDSLIVTLIPVSPKEDIAPVNKVNFTESYFGMHLGMGLGNALHNVEALTKSRYSVSPFIGFSAQLRIAPRLAVDVQPAIQFSRGHALVARFLSDNYFLKPQLQVLSVTTRQITYFNVPLMLGYAVTPRHSLGIGGFGNGILTTSGEMTKATYYKGSPYDESTAQLTGFKGGLDKFSYGLGAAYTYNRGNMALRLAYFKGLNDVLDDAYYFKEAKMDRMSSVQLSLIYKIVIKP